MRKYSKLSTSTSSSSIQNGHIIRFLMVIGAVILTLFIYAFYNSAPISPRTSLSSSSAALLYQSALASEGSAQPLASISSSLSKINKYDDIHKNINKNSIITQEKVVNSHHFSIRNQINQTSTLSTKQNTSNSMTYIMNTTQSQQLLQDADEILLQQNNANILDDEANLEKSDFAGK